MKKYYLFLLSLYISLASFSQGQGGAVTLFNKGVLSVGGSANDSVPAALYIGGDFQAEDRSAVYHQGKTVLTGDFINNVAYGNVFSGLNGLFEFRGTTAQTIRGTADKASNYIDFPDNVVINNRNVNDLNGVSVTLDPLMGASVKLLNLQRGRFIVDSKPSGERNTDIAHLFVKKDGNVIYNRDQRVPRYENGIIQVNLALGNNYKEKRVVGFTPPFQRIYADYFFHNFLSQPSDKSLIGDQDKLVADPRVPLQGGVGFIAGLGLIPDGDIYYTTHLDPQWRSALFEDKVREQITFARRFAPESFTQFLEAENTLDRFTGESLNINDVRVNLTPGFNYIGNPFTVPINMTSFVDNMGVRDEWNVVREKDRTGDLWNCFYVLSQGTGTYDPTNVYSQFSFNVSYLLGQDTGGTLTYEGGYSSMLIAPMQLLVLRKYTPGNVTLTIPASARTHGGSKYFRSKAKEPFDELLIETKDSQTGGYDRLCVVFRDNADMDAIDAYDVDKLFNKSGGVNQIYTRSTDNQLLTTNMIPPTATSLVMYFEPSRLEQEVSLTAHRMKSLRAVGDVILEDKKTGLKTDLRETPAYNFVSSPTDKIDRFVLHFNSPTGLDDYSQGAIRVYYGAGAINVDGLQANDMGSVVTVTDAQGRLICQHKIAEVPECRIEKELSVGTYLVKLTGNNALVTKLLVQ